MTVNDVTYDGVEDGVAQELKSFVVDGLSFGISPHDALVHQSQLIVADVVWTDADNAVKRQIKLLLLAEREPYSVYDVGNRSYFIQHTS